MHGLVLAAGEGSRLAAAGIEVPKPFVEVAGRSLLFGVLGALDEVGCEAITCLVREEHARAAHGIAAPVVTRPPRVVGCRTPSSLHTLAIGLAEAPPGPVFCAMVDTVMPRRDWRMVYAAVGADLAAGADAALVVTPFVDDERPVYVKAGSGRRVVAVGETPMDPVRVTGGVYGLGPAVRGLCHELLDAGHARVRSLLAAMVDRGLAITAVEVARVVDVDRPADLEAADRWLRSRPSGGRGVR